MGSRDGHSICSSKVCSYDCPFQTPVSAALRRSWTKIGPHLAPIIIVLRSLGEIVQCHVLRIIIHLPHLNIRCRLRSLLQRIQPGVLRVALCLPRMGFNIRRRLRHPPLPTVQEDSCSSTSSIHQATVPWLTKKELDTIQTRSVNDVRCVSWILWNITDPEALDAAIRLAGTIRWFEDGVDIDPPYDLILSTFHACLDSNGKVYPGSRDRAYYSGQAITWIHTLALCQSQELTKRFPPLAITHAAPASDHDFTHLLKVNSRSPDKSKWYFDFDNRHTTSHSQWISNVSLHRFWADRTTSHVGFSWKEIYGTTIPLDVVLNRLLQWCIYLRSPIEEEALKVQDKSCGISYCCLFSCLHHRSPVIA